MKHVSLVAVLLTVIFLALVLTSATASQLDEPSLVSIPCRNRAALSLVEESGVPVYARLAGGGASRLLAGATPEKVDWLRRHGLPVTVLDADMRGARYYLVYPGPRLPHPNWAQYGSVLLDDGAQALLRTSSHEAERLAEAGAELRAITLDPKPLQPAVLELALPSLLEPDPIIQQMVAQVESATIYSYTGDLSGEWPVIIDGSPYTIATRHTYSDLPIQKATQYAGEHLASLGLGIEYHQWEGSTYPNVIGELAGQTDPEDVFILCAHIDDMPSGTLAPGADDNASGTTAVLVAADILTQYQWGCTLRFVLFTGEEQGLWGSKAYALRAHNSSENILGVLNLDMIAWNTPDSSPDIDLHANSELSATLELAQVFSDVVHIYDLDLIPQIVPNGTDRSDHASFWDHGYPAILGIEDFGDFNRRYHTDEDQLQYLDMDYYTDFVKASVATFAHMSDCLIPPVETGYLDGYVTSARDDAPIAAATVSITDVLGHGYPRVTDGSGYYTASLVVGTYTVTASAEGYAPTPVSSAAVLTNTVTTRDFALQPLPQIAVTPWALTATLAPGEVATRTLWITNTGKGDLAFALLEQDPTATAAPLFSGADLPWLSEIPEAGALGPAEGLPVAVIFDAGGLDAQNTYLGLLDVESNDPTSPHVAISVTLTVEPFHFYFPLVWQDG